MAALDWSRCPAVESIPDRVGGAWVFKGYPSACGHYDRESRGSERRRGHREYIY